MAESKNYRHDVIVVGAGLFGSMIARNLDAVGMNVLVIDDRRQLAGSPPAACLFRDSWLAGLGKEIVSPAMEFLEEHYPITKIEFSAGVGAVRKPVMVNWIKPRLILKPASESLHGTVTRIHNTDGSLKRPVKVTVQSVVGGAYIEEHIARTVVVATGIWGRLLVPQMPEVTAKSGLAYLWPREAAQPTITPWAPYRQLVIFNRGDGLWASDGSAIPISGWKPQRVAIIRDRILSAAARSSENAIELQGYRPYIAGHRVYVEEVAPNLWVANGAAKSGTILAAHAARKITKALL